MQAEATEDILSIAAGWAAAGEQVALATVVETWGSSPRPPGSRLAVTASRWEGLGLGHGHLRARRVRVEATGRRRAARPRTADLWLPAADGTIGVATEPARDRPSGSSGDPRPPLRVVGGSSPARVGRRRAG